MAEELKKKGKPKKEISNQELYAHFSKIKTNLGYDFKQIIRGLDSYMARFYKVKEKYLLNQTNEAYYEKLNGSIVDLKADIVAAFKKFADKDDLLSLPSST
jgi:hypothetical protein